MAQWPFTAAGSAVLLATGGGGGTEAQQWYAVRHLVTCKCDGCHSLVYNLSIYALPGMMGEAFVELKRAPSCCYMQHPLASTPLVL
jgi:hypothetical protein